ncbi:hypothetical protein MKW98_022076 [Papaver atlanticum]|uniref:Peptidase A1 domain-containing protein n=1 Tax=Papaver atlanticum TaxID=357466 RepID=A0AAD4TIF1_9MAGN|nr:hypothetical protein MKW98_022076 [Papaver atlanticum]
METKTHLTLVFIVILLSIFVHCDADGNVFFYTVHLIHRDFSPQSPYYNSLETHHYRVQTVIRRSISRTNGTFKRSSSSVAAALPTNANHNNNITTLNTVNGDYLMNISIGTPPRQLLVSIDTGSIIIWLQCKPCEDFYEQNEPLFDPKESSSYKSIHFLTPVCFKLNKSSSIGHLAFETLTFDSTSGRSVKIPQFAIGCGHSNEGFKYVYSNSIVGLGTCKISFISQLGAKIDSKFSYCLVYADIGLSKFNFCSHAEIIGKDVISTPFITVEEGLYYLTLKAVSVNDKRISFKSKYETDGQEGNIDILSEVKKQLYFKDDKNNKYPSITFHFTGSDIKLTDENSYISTPDGVFLTFHSTGDGHVLYGNLAQMGFLVEYDLKDKKVSFKPTYCSKNN